MNSKISKNVKGINMINQARRSNRRVYSAKKKPIKHGLREIVLIFFCFVALYLSVSLLTYYGGDPGWSHSGPVEEVKNKGGIVGALFADLFIHLFGYFAYLFPLMVGYMGWLIYQGRHHDILAEPKSLIVPGIGFVFTLSAGCGLAIVHFMAESALLPSHAGGILGTWLGNGLVMMVDRLGATLILLAVFFTGVTLLTGLSWLKLMDTLGYHALTHWLPVTEKYMNRQFLPWFSTHTKYWSKITKNGLGILLLKLHQWVKTLYRRWKNRVAEWRQEREMYDRDDIYEDEYENEYIIEEKPSRDKSASHHSQVTPIAAQPSKTFKITPKITPQESFLLPALNLLNPVPRVANSLKVQMLPQRIIDAFAALKVKVEMNAVHQGPVLTRFDIHTITPISTEHLDELGRVLAKYLSVEHVHVVETQPEMLAIEMPHFKRKTVYLSELLNSPEYQENSSSLAVALGQDVNGQAVIVDLTRIPHILMAGSHISEKTVAINTLILSLLYKSTPNVVRFLLIDSISQELSVYTDLPHLLMPVITDMAQTPRALQWCVQEMERRYRLMAQMGVRNIEDYNQALLLQEDELSESSAHSNLFYIVVFINEIAELMTKKTEKKAEQSLTHLTQKARAAGIHIVLATQHLTVNVITGLIKANIPTRMAFQVNNQSESRTILGQMGAEKLLGQGDMLYLTAGTGKPVRVHGSFVSDEEVQKLVTNLKSRAKPDYIDLKN
jgi:S-DNA-T family DNA segregation ATPase FtsK/SpoIIIE